MTYAELFEQAPLPTIYMRNDVACYLDPYREKLIQITPEETVRQKTAVLLESVLAVPHNMIMVEQHMSHFDVPTKDRADIIILRYNERDNMNTPVAVVECKAPEIPIVEATIKQAVRYADALGADYIFATNGTEIVSYKYEDKSNQYIPLDKSPSYEEMLGGKFSKLIVEPVPERIPFEKLNSRALVEQYEYDGFIGKDTNESLKPHIINFFEALLDTSVKIKPHKYKGLEIISDYGVRTLSYGNASGGMFMGPYRSFIVKTDSGNTEFVGITVTATKRNDNSNSPEKTALCVSIDSYEKSHHALQLNFDSGVKVKNSKMIFTHSGRITVGHKGSAKSSDLIDFLKVNAPSLISDDTIMLGELDASSLMYISRSDYETLIENLILYAVERDIFRNS